MNLDDTTPAPSYALEREVSLPSTLGKGRDSLLRSQTIGSLIRGLQGEIPARLEDLRIPFREEESSAVDTNAVVSSLIEQCESLQDQLGEIQKLSQELQAAEEASLTESQQGLQQKQNDRILAEIRQSSDMMLQNMHWIMEGLSEEGLKSVLLLKDESVNPQALEKYSTMSEQLLKNLDDHKALLLGSLLKKKDKAAATLEEFSAFLQDLRLLLHN